MFHYLKTQTFLLILEPWKSTKRYPKRLLAKGKDMWRFYFSYWYHNVWLVTNLNFLQLFLRFWHQLAILRFELSDRIKDTLDSCHHFWNIETTCARNNSKNEKRLDKIVIDFKLATITTSEFSLSPKKGHYHCFLLFTVAHNFLIWSKLCIVRLNIVHRAVNFKPSPCYST